tara:strand:- start:1814 stop:2017 length:204 start_codon:yes stop_codon:yes gene_type:complete
MLDLSSIVKELERIKTDLQHSLDRVDSVLMDARILAEGKKVEFTEARGEIVSMPDSFSEDKEGFIAP